MKKRNLIVLIAVVLAVTLAGGCSKEETGENANESREETAPEREENLTFGRVTAVGEDSITIELVQREETETPKEQESEGQESEEQADQKESEEPPEEMNLEEMFTFSGEEEEIAVSDETRITRGGMMGGLAGAAQGTPPDGKFDAEDRPDKEEGSGESEESEQAEESEQGARTGRRA